MIQPRSASLLLALALCVACATAPPSTPPQAGPPKVSLFCNPHAKSTSFASLGVPQGERPVAVAMGERYLYVRFEPSRLLRIDRTAEGKVDMMVGSGEWQAMDVDPRDGSIWLAKADSPTLVHVTLGLNAEVVKLQKVEGAGLHQLVVTKDEIYASPGCAPAGIWRIDREGKVLGTAFPAPAQNNSAETEPLEVGHPAHPDCAFVRLARDADGRIVAHESARKKSYRLESGDTWSEQPISWFDDLPAGPSHSVKGVDVGSRSEQWYLGGRAGSLFFYKGTPVFLGGVTTGRLDVPISRDATHWNTDTVLLIRDGAASREVIEQCGNRPILDVAMDATTYAAVTPEGLFWGEVAKAPDLPR